MEPLWCGVCGEEQLVLKCEQDAGVCQGCQQAAVSRAEDGAERAEFYADLAAGR